MQNLVQVFRVQNSEGVGPYNGGSKEWQDAMSEEFGDFWNEDQHPLPTSYSLPRTENDCAYYDDSVRFCFASLKQLQQWFTLAMREYLKKDGYQVNVYLVHPDDLSYNDKQAFFELKDNTVCLQVLDIVSFNYKE